MLRASMSFRWSMSIPLTFPDSVQDNRRRIVARHIARIDDQLRIHRNFVRVVDPREVRDLSAARPGVQSLDVTSLTFLDWRRDVNLDEVITQLAHEAARFLIWRYERHHDDHSVPLEPARKESDVADVSIALGVCETDFRENVANGVAVEVLHPIAAPLEAFHDLFGDCALPRAR